MDVKELIESGSLELYVMEALTPEETREIDALRKTNNEVDTEIQRIEEAMIAYASTHAVKPKEELKEKIAGKLNFSIMLDLDMERVDSILIQMPGIYKFAAAASVALIAIFSVSSVYFAFNYRTVSHQLADLQAQNSQLAEQVKTASGTTEKLSAQLAVLSNPANRQITLSGQAIAPNAAATIYWNKSAGTVYLNTQYLPAIAANEQFQLWAIVDGKPVDLGVVDKDTKFTAMKTVTNAQAFAITLEPLGGRPTPTLEKMYVMGKV